MPRTTGASGRSTGGHRPWAARAAATAAVVALAAGCTQSTDVERAEAEVQDRTEDVAAAQAKVESTSAAFCNSAGAYVSALDRYGKIFTDQTATVGDVRTLGSDLERPRDAVAKTAQSAVDAHHELASAQAELAAAQADLDALRSGSTTTGPDDAPEGTSTTTTLLPAATVERIRTEEAELTAALESVTDETPLTQAGQQVNAAAFALEVAWMRVLTEAGCLTDEQMAEANAAVTGYTAAVQTAMQLLGHLDGEVDGIYGPATVAAVQSFQMSQGLPATGYVDVATAAAIEAQLVAEGGTAAVQAVATTAAVQSTLRLAGYWDGPVDGQWTQALTDALTSFQTALSVPPTGVVDNATLEALRQAIADGAPSVPTPTAPTPTVPTPTAPSTTARPSPTTAVPTSETPRR